MACNMTDEAFEAMSNLARLDGRWLAQYVSNYGGSLGSAREAIITAFTSSYDEKAAKLMQPYDENPEWTYEAFERVTEPSGLVSTRHFMWLGREAGDE